jgi:deazaflavin-dependent oxidoreductase (nitroreductase family)
MATNYQRPGWFTKHVFNPIVAGLTRLGVSLVGSRVLEVRGRKSGEWRRTPVNPLEYAGARFIVAPRGETQWVRNLRASGEGRLRKGRRIEEFTASSRTYCDHSARTAPTTTPISPSFSSSGRDSLRLWFAIHPAEGHAAIAARYLAR